MKDLIIIGASGFGREVMWLTERINAIQPTWTLTGFMDDNKAIQGTNIEGYPILGGLEKAVDYPNSFYICAVGAAKVRKNIISRLERIINPHYAILIDPSAIISDRVQIGAGCMICAGNIITVDITIGKHVIVNLDCTIGHDAVIKDFVTLYPSVNVSGHTNISEAVELGTGVQIIQGKSIVEETIVGAGAVVVSDLKEPGIYVGIPARKIEK